MHPTLVLVLLNYTANLTVVELGTRIHLSTIALEALNLCGLSPSACGRQRELKTQQDAGKLGRSTSVRKLFRVDSKTRSYLQMPPAEIKAFIAAVLALSTTESLVADVFDPSRLDGKNAGFVRRSHAGVEQIRIVGLSSSGSAAYAVWQGRTL